MVTEVRYYISICRLNYFIRYSDSMQCLGGLGYGYGPSYGFGGILL